MDIEIRNLSKAYGDKVIFENFSLTLESGGLYGLTAPSGRGKTTLLRLLLGLLDPDAGTITPGVRYSAVFQTDRLLPNRTPVDQLLFVGRNRSTRDGKEAPVGADDHIGPHPETHHGRHDRDAARTFLLGILPAESLDQPVGELSGGMQRRVAIARALWADSDAILMDEPFTGLDEDTLHKTADFILKERKGRTLLLSTHQKELLETYPFEWLTLPPTQL